MSAGLIGWRALARIAWREVIRRKARTALVVLLVALPMAALTFLSVAVRSSFVVGERADKLYLGPLVDVRLERPLGLMPTGTVGVDGVAFPFPIPGAPTATGGSASAPVEPSDATMLPSAVGSPATGNEPLRPTGISSDLTSNSRLLIDDVGGTLRSATAVATVTRAYQGRVVLSRKRYEPVLEAADFTDPLLAHNFRLRTGAWPTTASDTAISRAFAAKSGLTVGSMVPLSSPFRADLRVTGIFDQRDALRQYTLALAPSAGLQATEQAGGSVDYYVDLGSRQSPVTQYYLSVYQLGFSPTFWSTRDGRRNADFLAYLNVGFIIANFLLGIVVTAAFALGARRQLRQLGLVAAAGGDPTQVGRVVTLQGLVTAVLGSLVGVGLGALAIAVTASRWNWRFGFVLPGLVVHVSDWIVAGLLALVAGTVAAGIAARQARRVPVLAALGGRRPLAPITARFPAVGAIFVALGLVWLFATTGSDMYQTWMWAAFASVAILFGGVLCAPYLVGRMEPLAGRLRGAARIAARRLARQRSRSGPLVGAVMATAAVAIAVSAIALSAERRSARSYWQTYAANQVLVAVPWNPSGLQGPTAEQTQAVVDGVRRILPAAKSAAVGGTQGVIADGSMAQLRVPAEDGNGLWVLVASTEALRNAGATPQVVAAFDAGTAVLIGSVAPPSGRLTGTLVKTHIGPSGIVAATVPVTAALGQPPVTDEHPVTLPVIRSAPFDFIYRTSGRVCADPTCPPQRQPMLLLPQSLAAQIGMPAPLNEVVIINPRPLTADERSALGNIEKKLEDEGDAARFATGTGENTAGPPTLRFEDNRQYPMALLEGLVSGIATLLAMLVVAVALAFTAVDNRADDATLTALGASPGSRRRVRAWEGALLAVTGVLLAVPVGFLPSLAIRQARVNRSPVVFPWLTVAILTIGVPVVAWIVGYSTARTPRSVAVITE